MAGKPILAAPMNKAGVVLSHPPMSTTPSQGYERNNSSVSIAKRFRYIIVDGFWKGSAKEIAGISIGKPPACQTPRFISSALCRK
jgi:hypothetical protein